VRGVIEFTFLVSLFIACACSASPPVSPPSSPVIAPEATSFAAQLPALNAASCLDPDAFVTPQSITFRATELPAPNLEGAQLSGLAYAGGWHLTSDDPNVGGLSGLSLHPKDHLLAISDSGAFVWISMADSTPSGYAAISYMRDENGSPLSGKNAADSEGLELIAGTALVSFERDNRVLAFDLANCGAAAKGVLVADIPSRPEGLNRAIPENQGAEALTLSSDGHLTAGLEIAINRQAALGTITPQKVSFSERIPRPQGGLLTGLDTDGDAVYALFREYSPFTGNKSVITRQVGNAPPQTLATLKRPFPVDNFEGITVTNLPDGTVRLYIISDDNFSVRQRTLLLAFDLIE